MTGTMGEEGPNARILSRYLPILAIHVPIIFGLIWLDVILISLGSSRNFEGCIKKLNYAQNIKCFIS